jgi:hypothetical protein
MLCMAVAVAPSQPAGSPQHARAAHMSDSADAVCRDRLRAGPKGPTFFMVHAGQGQPLSLALVAGSRLPSPPPALICFNTALQQAVFHALKCVLLSATAQEDHSASTPVTCTSSPALPPAWPRSSPKACRK